MPEPPPTSSDKPPGPRQGQMAHRRAARIARWKEVRRRHAAGAGVRGIAWVMGINRRTVRRLIDTPIPPRNRIVHSRPDGLSSPSLQPYVSYLQDRWEEGRSNFSQLYRETLDRGYGGSRSLLYTALQVWRGPRSLPK